MARGLLTDMERKALRGEIEDANQRSTYISRVRTRIEDRVNEDAKILRENQPELYEVLQDQVLVANRD